MSFGGFCKSSYLLVTVDTSLQILNFHFVNIFSTVLFSTIPIYLLLGISSITVS